MDALILTAAFTAAAMLAMRHESTRYTAKRPRSFAELERRSSENRL